MSHAIRTGSRTHRVRAQWRGRRTSVRLVARLLGVPLAKAAYVMWWMHARGYARRVVRGVYEVLP